MEIVMMGDPNSGRTSILKIIFQKIMPSRTMMLAETKKMDSYEFKIEKLDFRVYDFPCSYDTHEGSPNEQMILKNAVALIYVLDPTRDIEKSIPHFLQLYDYIKQKNTNNCKFSIFINKTDLEFENNQEQKEKFHLKLKKKLQDKVDIKIVDFIFTSIHNYTIYDGFSRVVQKSISCSKQICRMLNKLAKYCKIDKIYLFDIGTKLYIGNNSQQIMQLNKFEICSEIVDIFLEMTQLYKTGKNNIDVNSTSEIMIGQDNQDEQQNREMLNRELFLMKPITQGLGLVYRILESDYYRPYLIDQNINVFRKGFMELFEQAIKMQK